MCSKVLFQKGGYPDPKTSEHCIDGLKTFEDYAPEDFGKL